MGSQMRTILLTVLLLASAISLFAQNADQAPTVQPSPGFQTNERRGPRPQLNLTEDQKAKINEVFTPAQRTILDTSRKELQQSWRPGPRNQEQVPNQE